MVKRFGVLFLALSIGLIVFAGCSTGTSSNDSKPGEDADGKAVEGKKVTLTFWKAPHVKTEKELWAKIIEKFEAENPNIKVEFLETPWDGWDQKYTAAFAGSNPPDVSYMSEYFVKFAQNGKLADLTNYFSEEEKSKYSPSVIDYLTINGKVYTKPFLAGTSVVFYNKELFEKEKIEIPQTWDELVEAAKKLTKAPDQWGIGNLDALNAVAFMGQAGANLYADNNKDVTKLGFDTPEGIAGLQFYTDLVLKHAAAPPMDFYSTSEQENQAFFDGKIGMLLSQVSFSSTIKTNAPNLKFGAFLNPAGPASDPAKQREAYAGIGTLAIAEASKHKDEAWKFIEFVTAPENAKMYLEPAGFFSPLPDANEEMYAGDEVMEVAKESIKNMILWTPNEKFGKVLDIIKQMREAAFRGVKTPEQAIKDAVKEFESQS
ncbi:ABC transporter substrate-binding protein [Paenibacillus sp. GCM10027626]|uniref:ABC transporter substrate-binding protein n=1 Tax=Paenibacillus sp. GCM10027626 TaxID=3273411 RepID=UPI0036282F8A